MTHHLNHLLDIMPGYAYRSHYAPAWTVEWVSKGVETITGYPTDYFHLSPCHTLHGLILARDKAYVTQVIADAIDKSQPYSLEYRIKNNQGQTVWLSEQGLPIFSPSGQLIGIEGYVSNISEQVIAQKEQFDSEKKYSLLFRQMMNAFILLTPVKDASGTVIDFRYEEMNPAFDDHSAIPSQQCLGKTILEVQGHMGPQIVSKYLEVFDSGSPHQFEIYNAEQDRYYSIHAFKSSPDKLAVLFHDISESARLHAALKRSEAQYRTLFESIFSAFAVCEPVFEASGRMIDFEFIECNPAFVYHTGLPPMEVTHKRCRSLPVRCFDEWLPLFEQVCKTGKPKTEERFNTVLDRYFRISIFSPGKNRFAMLLDDISEQKQIQQRIIDTMIETEENERRKLAGDLHDEIGPLLSSMRMYNASLQRKTTDTKNLELVELLSRLTDDSIEKIREISHNLSPAILERYGLVSAISAECELMQPIIPVTFNHNIRQIRFSARIETTLYRIVKELMNNTKKHSGANRASLDIHFTNEQVLVKYHDNGSGFPTDIITSEPTRGMGLLNIEMRVRSINGEYAMTSEPGTGFTFEMTALVNRVYNPLDDDLLA
ncbi:PAS domain-containing protein [Breznakibacter xylanolyticus]|uniref:histidine kinase n=1 Tax=Breznakibacter xylanolyticus TaxID=990 RepID=A0A2W7NGP3_9BACT|nr:PAS domain-containing protein [Breznakibacter xylanolyticus]PZX15864.1 PAS domain-containing protein [Breznakibacter xylanolyticus]